MGSTTHPPAETEQDQPTIEERRALIERIAASEHFRRSARLRDFLLYVGRQSLKEGCPEINEQEVGAHVFGRSSSYDRSQDNIVRVNATELRKRIEVYFETEGAHETLVLEIPRGGYKPLFHRRARRVESPATLPPELRPAAPSPVDDGSFVAAKASRRTHLVWAGLSVVLAAVCVVLFQQNHSLRTADPAWQGKPALATFWGGFLRYHQQTDVVLGDDSLSLIEDLIGHPVSLSDYLNRSFMLQIQSSNLSPERKFDLDQIFGHNLVTFGGVRSAQETLALIPALSTRDLTHARYYVADAIKQHNVILVGGRKANPWVHLFDDKMNFVTDFDYTRGQAFVANLHPKPGEQATYTVPYKANELVGYSVVAYLPNPSQTGNAIILAGTDSDATDAAAEFLTSEKEMQSFLDKLHAKTFPYFEVLLKTSRLSGTSLSAEMLAYRTYPDSARTVH